MRAAARDHATEFSDGIRELDAVQARTGLPFTADEKRRLAALAIFIAVGLVKESIPATTTEEPVTA